MGLKEPHGKISNPEMPMDNDKTSLNKSLSFLANDNRKVKSGPLSKDRKLETITVFLLSMTQKTLAQLTLPLTKAGKQMSTFTKVFFFFFLLLF